MFSTALPLRPIEVGVAPETSVPTTRLFVPGMDAAELLLTVTRLLVLVMTTDAEELIVAPRFKRRALFPERFREPTLFVPEARELLNEAELEDAVAPKVKEPNPE